MNAKELRRSRIREATEVTKSGDTAAIVRLLDSPEATVREHAVMTVGRLRIRDATPQLIERTNDEEQSVRSAVALVLADVRDPACREALWTLTSDSSEDVRRLHFAAWRNSMIRERCASPSVLTKSAEHSRGKRRSTPWPN